MQVIHSLFVSGIIFCCAGCTHLGPTTVERDRFDYNTAIANSWKEQTLLNIVKLRYADMPFFVEVASVVNGYTLEGSVNLGRTVSSNDSIQGDFFNFGTTGKYTDRPTITYAPITGQQFNKSFMIPIPPRAVLFLMSSGWPVDLILPMTVDAMNGLRSEVAAGSSQRMGDTEYYRIVTLLRQIQKAGAVGMQILKENDSHETTMMLFHRERVSAEVKSSLQEVSALLGLKPGTREVKIAYGLIPKSDTEFAILTRSLLQILVQMATLVDVPPEHVEQGRTVPSISRNDSVKGDGGQLIKIEYSAKKPEHAFIAVNYRDYWFWIDDRDFNSKRTFAFLMILFSLMETGGKEGLPLVTIPAG